MLRVKVVLTFPPRDPATNDLMKIVSRDVESDDMVLGETKLVFTAENTPKVRDWIHSWVTTVLIDFLPPTGYSIYVEQVEDYNRADRQGVQEGAGGSIVKRND